MTRFSLCCVVHLKLKVGDAIVWNEPDTNNSFICVADIFEHQNK
jgi:hypothetical protein